MQHHTPLHVSESSILDNACSILTSAVWQVAVSHDEQSFVISGMGNAPYTQGPQVTTGYAAGTLSGRLTKVNKADGAYVWSKSFSGVDFSLEGSATLVKNECWGVAPLSDGYVLGCGTGIENCDDAGPAGQQKAIDCAAGTADARHGAFPRERLPGATPLMRTRG